MAIHVQVGQEVAVQIGFGRGEYRFGYVVEKVTPKRGVITVKKAGSDYTQQFDRDGYEVGKRGSVYADHIVTDVEAARWRQEQITGRREAATALLAVIADRQCNPEWRKETLVAEADRLQALLTAAREKIDALGGGR